MWCLSLSDLEAQIVRVRRDTKENLVRFCHFMSVELQPIEMKELASSHLICSPFPWARPLFSLQILTPTVAQKVGAKTLLMLCF